MLQQAANIKTMTKKKNKSLTKTQLIRRISDETELRTDVVTSVIDCFTDVMIKEIVENESFHLANCFSVSAKERKARKTKDLKTGAIVEYPPTRVLRVSLSQKILYWFRWKVRNERNEQMGATPETWKEAYEEFKKSED